MEALFLLMTFLVPIVTGLTEVVKKTGKITEKYVAIVPLLLGLIIAPLALPLPFFTASLAELFWAGGLSGLAAGGFYSVQNIVKK